MTDREILQRHLERLQAKLSEACFDKRTGAIRPVMTPKAENLQLQIEEIKYRMQKLDELANADLSLTKAPFEESVDFIMLPIVADLMNDVIAGVQGYLTKRGCNETIYATQIKQLRTATLAFIDVLASSEAGQMLLDADDTLIDALRKKIISFIKQRLKIKKK